MFLPASLALNLALAAVPLHADTVSVARIRFASPADTTPITSSRGPAFLIVVDSATPDPDRVDTLEVLATTAQGDHEVLKAVETAAASGRFVARVEVRGTHGYLAQYDDVIEVDGDAMDSATVNLEVTVDRGAVAGTARLELFFMESDAVRMRRLGGRGAAGSREPGPGRGAIREAYSVDGRRWGQGKRGVRFIPVRVPASPG